MNYFVGFAGMMWVVMPILYWYFDFWQAQSFPSVLGSGLFTASQPHKTFNVSAVLLPDNTLDWTKWETEKPMLLTPYFATTYGISVSLS